MDGLRVRAMAARPEMTVKETRAQLRSYEFSADSLPGSGGKPASGVSCDGDLAAVAYVCAGGRAGAVR